MPDDSGDVKELEEQKPIQVNFVKDQNVVMTGKVESSDPLKDLMEKCCGKMKLQMSQVRFMVDGERTTPEDCAEKLKPNLQASCVIEVTLEQHGGGPESSLQGKCTVPGVAESQLLVPKAKAVARRFGATAPVSPKSAPPRAAAVTSTALVLPKAAVPPVKDSVQTGAPDERWTGKQWLEMASCFASLSPPAVGFTWAVSRNYRHMLQENQSWLKHVPTEFLFQINVASNSCRYHADAPLLRSETHPIISPAPAENIFLKQWTEN